MKNHQFITGFISRLKIFYILGVLISFSNNSSLEEVQTSLREIAYAYYMRGPNIQYNDIMMLNIQHFLQRKLLMIM